MANKVNLDALLPREDFHIEGNESPIPPGQLKSSMTITDLHKDNWFLLSLRKPDFQRETSDWEASKIYKFIDSFVHGDLIPAIILWRNPSGNLFIVDGAHRISALIAWINDDYGDGDLSKKFYQDIAFDQIEVAKRTRELVNKEIGTYGQYIFSQPDEATPERESRAKLLASQAIILQWITGDPSKAEESFLKINQQATPISEIEKRVLKARKKPNGIATRAIIKGGQGHKYWGGFSPDVQQQIEELAQEIHKVLFEPELQTPIKTLDLPVAGKAYSSQSLPLVLDFVDIVNNVSGELPDDIDGKLTQKYLKECKKIAQRISSDHPGSLGISPFAYFYSINGRHKPASFYAITALILQLEKESKFREFTSIRSKFETILVKYDYLVQQIVRHYRGAFSSYPHIQMFYWMCITKLLEGKTEKKVIEEIVTEPEFAKYLAKVKEENKATGKEFSSDTKSEAYLRQAIKKALKCAICGGYLHKSSTSIDHKARKEDGGMGSADNAQLTHMYCNTTYKN